MVVFCPNIGILSAVVLSIIPLMRPFAWQSLLLPILPVQDSMLDILEAPVPFILGVKVGDNHVLEPQPCVSPQSTVLPSWHSRLLHMLLLRQLDHTFSRMGWVAHLKRDLCGCSIRQRK